MRARWRFAVIKRNRREYLDAGELRLHDTRRVLRNDRRSTLRTRRAYTAPMTVPADRAPMRNGGEARG
jgi:hypothetical protein